MTANTTHSTTSPGTPAAEFDRQSQTLVDAGYPALAGLDEAGFRAVLEREPGNTDALNNLGVALRKQGKLAEALECYARSLWSTA